MGLRYTLALTTGFFMGLRIFDPLRFDNFTEGVLLLLRASGFIIRPDVLFFGLIILEAIFALAIVFDCCNHVVLPAWLTLITAQISANLFSLIGALNSSCGTGVFRDAPYLILVIQSFILGLLLLVYLKTSRSFA